MEIIHIKVNGTYYKPVKPNTQAVGCWDGVYEPICTIKKLLFGRYQIDYYDRYLEEYGKIGGNIYPNARIIAYPSGIEEIKYKLE